MANPITAAVKAIVNAECKRTLAAIDGGLGGILEDLFDKIDGLASILAIIDAFGYDASTTTGLTFGFKAGLAHNGSGGTPVEVDAGTVALTDDSVNYVELDMDTETVTANTTAFADGCIPLYKITTVGGSIPVENIEDNRPWFGVLGDGAVTADSLADEVADLLPEVAFTIGAEAGNAIVVTGQVKDIQGNNLAAKRLVELWVADSADAWECATAPSGGWTIGTGTDFGVITADKRRRVYSNASGVFAVTITEAAAKTFYVGARIGGRCWYSAAVTFV